MAWTLCSDGFSSLVMDNVLKGVLQCSTTATQGPF